MKLFYNDYDDDGDDDDDDEAKKSTQRSNQYDRCFIC